MKTQRGMTLIEVMVAMLVLSIAMIGGISFFTNAYKINYSHLEHANRLDHALRYVERLKVQRRNYPTVGYFPNFGPNGGFTVYFVDSMPEDKGPKPYFYENFLEGDAGTIRIPVKKYITFQDKFGEPTDGAATYTHIGGVDYLNNHYVRNDYYSNKSPAVPGYGEGYNFNVPNSWTTDVYVIGNDDWDSWNNSSLSDFKLDTEVCNSTSANGLYKRDFHGLGKMSYDIDIIQQRLDKLTNDPLMQSATSHVNYKGQTYFKVPPQVVPDGNGGNMWIDGYFRYSYNSGNPENVKYVYEGDYDAFLQLTFAQLLQRAKAYPTSISPVTFPYRCNFLQIHTGTTGNLSSGPNDWGAYAGKYVYPAYYEKRANVPPAPAKPGRVMYQPHTKYNDGRDMEYKLTGGAEPEGNSAAGLSEVWELHSLRFYTAGNSNVWQNGYSQPSDQFLDNVNYSEVRRINAPFDPVEPNAKTINYDDYIYDERIYPKSIAEGGYGEDIYFIGEVYRSKASGKERIKKLWWWQPVNGEWRPQLASGGPDVTSRSPATSFTARWIIRFNVDVGDNFLGTNTRRLTKYRRSAYISVYSIKTEEEAKALVGYLQANYTDEKNGSDLEGAVKYIKELGKDIILIPFLQLYAHDQYSTLCERLD